MAAATNNKAHPNDALRLYGEMRQWEGVAVSLRRALARATKPDAIASLRRCVSAAQRRARGARRRYREAVRRSSRRTH